MNSASPRPKPSRDRLLLPADELPLPGELLGLIQGRSRKKLWAVAATTSVLVTALSGESATASVTATTPAAPSTVAAIASAQTGLGWEVNPDGLVTPFGGAHNYGSVTQALKRPIVGIAVTPDGRGYWLVGADGGVFSFGDAPFLGSEGGHTLNRPIVGIAATADGKGYWLVGADGGVFSFGDAPFLGSKGASAISRPVVGIAATPNGKGYWLVGEDGGVFSYGDAAFFGSEGGHPLNRPVVSMRSTSDGEGYWLVGADGGVFNFGDAPFPGSLGSTHLTTAIVGMAPAPSGGSWLVAADGSYHLLPAIPAHQSSPALPAHHFPPHHRGPISPPTTSTTTTEPATTTTTQPPATTTTTRPPVTTTTSIAPGDGGGSTPASRWPTSLFSSPLGSRSMADPGTSSDYTGQFVSDYQEAYGAVGVNELPIWTVGTSQPDVPVTVSAGCNNFLGSTGTEIPIPPAAWTVSSDDPIVIWQPATDTEWELWRADPVGNGTWTACWGGMITTDTSDGVFPSPYGLSASGISYLATTITESDIASGAIDHTIGVDLPRCDGPQVAPADRTDCGSDPGQPHEGTWYRLPTNLSMPSGLTPFAQMVFHALQTYGMVVLDQAGAVMVQAENSSDWAEQGHNGVDPITASWDGQPEYEALSGIPWSDMLVVSP